jgi:hypothetical protein
LPRASEGAPEDNDQHLLAISDVDAIADIALAPEFGPERTSPVPYAVMGVTRLGLKCDTLHSLGRLGIWMPMRRGN